MNSDKLENNKEKIKNVIDICLNNTSFEADIRFDEAMSEHTTFKTGGPADCWIRPGKKGFEYFCIKLLNIACQNGINVFILGGGANIVVSDKGIRGIVLDTNAWSGETALSDKEDVRLVFKSGTEINEAADIAAAAGLSGFEFLTGMPGTIGGAVWMNARCYNREIADVLKYAEVIVKNKITDKNDRFGKNEYIVKKIEFENGKNKNDFGFGYKRSPFQEMDCIILSTAFQLEKGNKDKIKKEMEFNRKDRYDKGHYQFPCAGSVFKNNHDFGKPTGKIIDELGLKGLKIGGAQIAPFHGNIIINTGKTCSSDIRCLVDDVRAKVKTATGLVLEPEIIFVGEW